MFTPFLQHGALSVLGIAELARLVNQCCIEIHREGVKEEGAQVALFKQRLADWLAVPVWVQHRVAGDRAVCSVFLSEGEMHCATRRFCKPRRESTAHVLVPRHVEKAPCSEERSTIGALMVQPRAWSALLSRLDEKCVAPYAVEDLAGIDAAHGRLVWTWDNGWIHPTALLCAPLADVDAGQAGAWPLCLPSAWGQLHSHWHGELHLHEGHVLVVCDESGQYGLIRLHQLAHEPPRVVGRWLQACAWAWLAEAASSGASAIEAARQVEPDARGELVCDLISPLDGRRINPPGVKALLGTSHYNGTDYSDSLVVNEAGQGSHARVLGRVTRQGVLLCGQAVHDGMLEDVPWGLDDVRWLEMGSAQEGMIAVRSPDNGLWGFIDRRGAVAIAPQFSDVWGFNHGTAVVQPVGEARVGLIDKTGQWVLPPLWRTLRRESRRVIVAEDVAACWGALDAQGSVIVPFQPYADWLKHPDVCRRLDGRQTGHSWGSNEETEKRSAVIETIAAIWKQGFREKIRTAVEAALHKGGSLAGLEGLFDDDTSERDLREGGVWGLPVTLLRSKTHGLLRPQAGGSGRIACYYPVGLSTFGLEVEAPISDLPSCPEASVGIPWRDLTVAPPKPDEDVPS